MRRSERQGGEESEKKWEVVNSCSLFWLGLVTNEELEFACFEI